MPKKWIPLESNPEVMTEFASRIGLDTQQYSFHDIYGLDDEVRRLETQMVVYVLVLNGRFAYTAGWCAPSLLMHVPGGSGKRPQELQEDVPQGWEFDSPTWCFLQLLAMVPQPVLAVLLLYPITKESDEANKKGRSRQQHPPPRQSPQRAAQEMITSCI
jgi:hypothetical protein